MKHIKNAVWFIRESKKFTGYGYFRMLFKENLIELHSKRSDLPKTVVVGPTKLTYVSPSTRNSIDSKKLKEEEPAIAEKYTKTTNVKATIRLEEI